MFLESGAKYMVPIHWGTFILSHEPLEEPLLRLKKEAKRLGIEDRLVILRHGESFTIRSKCLLATEHTEVTENKY